MTSVNPEQFDAFDDAPRSLGDVIREFDASDSRLVMAYDRYIENSTDARYRELSKARDTLITDLETVLVSLEGDGGTAPGDDQRAADIEIASTLLIDTTEKHGALFAEYDDDLVVDPKTYRDMRDRLVGCLETGGHDAGDDADYEAFVAHVLAHFNEILSEDDDLVARLANAEYESPQRRVKRIASRVLAETARVAVASAVTLAIVYKFKK